MADDPNNDETASTGSATAQQAAAPNPDEHPPSPADGQGVEGGGTSSPSVKQGPEKGRSNVWLWVVGIASILALELYVYGHNGWIRVCVGQEGVTDFAALDAPRTQRRAAGFPVCMERLNLGMYSNGDEVARDALEQVCARGATLMGGDQRDCIRKEKGWIRRVDKQHVPPWDKRLYRRLLFLD